MSVPSNPDSSPDSNSQEASGAQTSSKNNGIIYLFANHPVACNLLMLLMILAGFWGINRINTQFFPSFELDIISIRVPWSGASSEDVARSITTPIEQEIKDLKGISQITSTSLQSYATISLELEDSANPNQVLDEVKQQIDALRNFPSDAEDPIVTLEEIYEGVADLVVTTPGDLAELIPLVRSMERDLLKRGISKINFSGLPDEEIAIQVSADQLHNLGLSLTDISQRLRERSVDLPAGTAGKDENATQIRGLNQQRDILGFETLPIATNAQGQKVTLGDVSQIERRAQEGQSYLTYQGQPAIKMSLQRTEADDTLEAAAIMNAWLDDVRPTLPPGVDIVVMNDSWVYLYDRIMLLVKNGLSGLLLVIVVLYLFLNTRVAFWVTVGIPVSFAATIAFMYFGGQTINVLSLFALIMALGIIVDDAIVVGEDAMAHFNKGESGLNASVGGARRMLPPVTASSLTTIAAFLPLLLMTGQFGDFMAVTPAVIICVIIASLIECFLILPGHLRHSLVHQPAPGKQNFKQRFEARFQHFNENRFRRWVTAAIHNRWSTICAAIALFIVCIGLIAGGRIGLTFFPKVETPTLWAQAEFTAGTPEAKVSEFLDHLENTLIATNESFEENILVSYVSQHRSSRYRGSGKDGDENGVLIVEITEADQRKLDSSAFIERWRSMIVQPPGLEHFNISLGGAGPPGKDLEVKLTGFDLERIKQASVDLQQAISGYQGVANIGDDLPFSGDQLIYELTPTAQALGLTTQAVGAQLRAAFDGQIAQIFHEADSEIEVRVMLPDSERNSLRILDRLPYIMPNGDAIPISNLVDFVPYKGVDRLQRIDGELAISVTAEVDSKVANENVIRSDLSKQILPDLMAQYGIKAQFSGRAEEQDKTFSEMKAGAVLALGLMYIILAWVFGSYAWPVAVLVAIPFGLCGAIFGHLVMGLDLTLFSFLGFFGLSGIVINDSIVLITFYKQLREQGQGVREAVINAVCLRLRAVLLTSLTTIAGLTPILFETSLQAQFLIPMVTTIVFGLAFGTMLILLVIPCLLITVEDIKHWVIEQKQSLQTRSQTSGS